MDNFKTIAGLLLLLTLFSCRKDPPACLGPTITVEKPINQAVKDCYVFQQGSWWVYQEIKTGKRDSVYVDSSTVYLYVDTNSCLNHSPWEKPGLREYDIYDTTFITHREYAKVYKTSTHYQKQREYRMNDINTIYTFWDGPNGVTRPTEYYFLSLDEQLDSLDIESYSFTDLYKLNHYQSRTYLKWYEDDWPYEDTMIYYLVPNIGLVKREDITKDEVWELKNYNVVQ